MSDTIIRVENLGKKYIIGHQAQSGGWKPNRGNYVALRDVVANGVKSFGKRLLGKEQRRSYTTEEFWALKNINFEIKRGEVVGIIGRNGAGKSTLLKILSRITEPTTGRIELRGRVASLLEVGTGFHPELTGRENIYLNGSILGMSRLEIRKKFDEIVAFAEVERFLDTPVKRYSSGMYVRLAFAVAAHLEPEILVVDEVLAVGDAAFQKKCLGKMEDVATNEGRTVLFVSHNMGAIEKLCRSGIVLQQGCLRFLGSRDAAINEYLAGLSESNLSLSKRKDRRGNGEIRITGIEIRDESGKILDVAQSGQNINVHFYFETYSDRKLSRIIIGLGITTMFGTPVFLIHNRLTGNDFGELPKQGVFICHLEKLALPPSNYQINYSVLRDGVDYLDSIHNAKELSVVDGDFYGSGEVPPISHGVSLARGEWKLLRVS